MRLLFSQNFPLIDFTALFVQRSDMVLVSHESTLVAIVCLKVVDFSWNGFLRLSVMC